MIGRKDDGTRMAGEVWQPKGLLYVLELSQNSQALGKVSDTFSLFRRNAMSNELQNVARVVKDG